MFGIPKGYLTYKARKQVLDLPGPGKTVFLSGTGRGGTTWLSNVINHDNAYRYMFEPFHPAYVPLISHFKSKQYLRPDNRDNTYLLPARRILAGKINNPWINKWNRKILIRKRLIKDIRTNLMLGWLKTNFPEIPIILLVRHPLAVVSSQMANGWQADLTVFLSQPELMQDYLTPYRDLLENPGNHFEALILQWCVETRVPLAQSGAGGIRVAFYENIFSYPEKELPELFAFIGQPFDPSVMDMLGQASKTARLDSPVRKGKNPVDHWRHNITAQQKEYCLEMLRRFGLDHIYGIDPLLALRPQADFLRMVRTDG